MTTPSFLIAVTLLFWGWQTGLLAAAVPMALVLEAHRFVPWRLDLRERDFSRLWKACAAIFLIVMVLVYLTNRDSILRVFQWAPVMFFPIVAAQSLSTSPRIDSRVFFLWIRMEPINLGYPFVLLLLGAACAAQERAALFFPLFAAMVGWTLWSARPRRTSPVLWALLFLVVSVSGFAGAVYLRELQKKVEDLYVGSFQHEVDTTNVKTAIGDIGKRKQSNRIVIRAKYPGEGREPLYLLTTSYDVYRGSSWYAAAAPMAAAVNKADGWRVGTGEPSGVVVEVSMKLEDRDGPLVSLHDACAIQGLKARSLSINRMGAVRAEGGPGLATYRVLRSRTSSFIGPPDKADLSVPRDEDPAISAAAAQLDLTHRTVPAVLDTVKGFFAGRFVYTLDPKSGQEGTSLTDFLLRTHAGHCEYFATAATLLLRKAGIPARYAVGYLAHEFSPREDAFVVRSRDAHAWVLVHVNGAWSVFDPTPPDWVANEQGSAGIFGPVSDLWSYCSFKFLQWRWGMDWGIVAERGKRGTVVIAAMALLFLAWKLRKRFHDDTHAPVRTEAGRQRSGHDSPFFSIEELLAGTEGERRPGETYAAWLGRIDGRQGIDVKDLARALTLHNQYRFDPAGITERERSTLGRDVEAWMKKARGTMQR